MAWRAFATVSFRIESLAQKDYQLVRKVILSVDMIRDVR